LPDPREELARRELGRQHVESWKQRQSERTREKDDHERRRSESLKRSGKKHDSERPDPRVLEVDDRSGLRPDHEGVDEDRAAAAHTFLYGSPDPPVQSPRNKPFKTETISDGLDDRNAMKVEHFGSAYYRMSVPDD
jgi:hypothetical protein